MSEERSRLEKWRNFLVEEFCYEGDEVDVGFEDSEYMESLDKLPEYGLKEDDIEFILRLKKKESI